MEKINKIYTLEDGIKMDREIKKNHTFENIKRLILEKGDSEYVIRQIVSNWKHYIDSHELINKIDEIAEQKILELSKSMSLKEFKDIYQPKNKKWKFDLFKIICQKCSSDRVEFNSDMELECGYYEHYSVEGKIIVKCHNCGNAFTLNFDELEN